MKVRVIDGACVLSVAKSPGAAPTALGGASFMPQRRREHKFNYGASLKAAPRRRRTFHPERRPKRCSSERSAAEHGQAETAGPFGIYTAISAPNVAS
jgi:hypothetical protein